MHLASVSLINLMFTKFRKVFGNGEQPIINFVMAYVRESLVFKITFGITLHIQWRLTVRGVLNHSQRLHGKLACYYRNYCLK